MIDPRIVRFIGRHHVLTLATVAGEQPYCSHAFYAYDPERNLLVFAADKTTRHAEEMQGNRQGANFRGSSFAERCGKRTKRHEKHISAASRSQHSPS